MYFFHHFKKISNSPEDNSCLRAPLGYYTAWVTVVEEPVDGRCVAHCVQETPVVTFSLTQQIGQASIL